MTIAKENYPQRFLIIPIFNVKLDRHAWRSCFSGNQVTWRAVQELSYINNEVIKEMTMIDGEIWTCWMSQSRHLT